MAGKPRTPTKAQNEELDAALTQVNRLQSQVAQLEAQLQEAQIEVSVYKARCAEKDEEISKISITATKLNLQLQQVQAQLMYGSAPEPLQPSTKAELLSSAANVQ